MRRELIIPEVTADIVSKSPAYIELLTDDSARTECTTRQVFDNHLQRQ